MNKINEIMVGINSKNWEWSYYGRNKSGVLENWDLFTYANKQFIGPRSVALTKKTREKINIGFHEMIKQLKYDNSYRLKILPVLSDEVRELWNSL